MQNQQPQQTATPEVVTQDFRKTLVELRQQAIAEGIALSKIDQYLLDRGDVAEGVKELIRKEMEDSATVERQVEVVPGISQPDQEAAPVSEKAPPKTEVAGEVNMLDAKQQIEQIKRETAESRTPASAETVPVPTPEVVAPVEKQPEIRPEQMKEQQIRQTAEKKEVPTTAGTQDTTTGMAVRTSLGMDGYAPSQDVASSAQEIAEKGPVNESKTWQASLLQRFLEMWGSFKALFTGE